MPWCVLWSGSFLEKKILKHQGGDFNFMQFNNLDNRLLLILAKKWKETGIGGPYRTSLIYKGYPELPDEYIAGELKKLNTKGLITFTSDNHRLYLTDKGISQIRSFVSINRWNSMGI